MEARSVDLRTSAREDERRRREEAAIIALQQQVDELRHLLREQVNRQSRFEEQLRQADGQVGQLRVEMDDVRQTAAQVVQLRQLDDHRIRQQLADLQSRVEEPQRPLRSLQAQMAEVVDQVRQGREHSLNAERQVEGVRVQVESYRNEIALALDAARQARDGLEGLHQVQATLARDIQKVSDQSRLAEQDLRRRLTEIEQSVTNLVSRTDTIAAYRPMLEEAIRQIRQEMTLFQPQLDALGARDGHHVQELARVQAQAEERDRLLRDRLEEMLTVITDEIGRMMDAVDEAVDGIHARIANWEEAQRELSGRFSQTVVQLSALQGHDERLAEVLRRTEERLVLLQLEQAQQAWEALMERRQAESERNA